MRKADRDGPQLAERQRLDPLVGDHQAPEAVGVEAAVGMGDVGPGQAEDPRIAFEGTLGELGQLTVVVLRQVVPDLPELLLDDVEVVDQPLGRRRDRPLVPDRLGERAVGGQEYPPVVGDAASNRSPGPGLLGDRLGGRQRLTVLFESFNAEQLGDDRFGCVDLAAALAQDRDTKLLSGLVTDRVYAGGRHPPDSDTWSRRGRRTVRD